MEDDDNMAATEITCEQCRDFAALTTNFPLVFDHAQTCPGCLEFLRVAAPVWYDAILPMTEEDDRKIADMLLERQRTARAAQHEMIARNRRDLILVIVMTVVALLLLVYIWLR